jgi:predicted amidohydrolase YtcJ
MAVAADLVLLNGRVFRSLAEVPCEAIAIAGRSVLATGSTDEIAHTIGPATRIVDLDGRLATAGLFDAHLHLLPYGLGLRQLDIRPKRARTLDGLLGLVRDRALKGEAGEWIQGRGYDHSQLDVSRHPTRDELDAVAPDNPVYLVRACGHVAVANSAALALAGIDESTAVPQGGLIEKAGGRLTGLLAETGRDRLKAVLPAPTDEDLVRAIEEAGRECLSYGITSVMDAAVGMRAGFREVTAYRTADRTGRLPLRVVQCFFGGPGGIADKVIAEGLVTGRGHDRLVAGPIKIFTDGSAGGRTAAMSEPYRGGGQGLLLLKDEELDALVRRYHEAGCQLAIHAIGDAAIEQTLNAIEAASEACPVVDRRHRIEHAGFATFEQSARMVRLGVEPVPQSVFLHEFGEIYVDVLGLERAQRSYPQKTWMDLGLSPAASTDAPVCGLSPFPNFHALMTRRTARGVDLGTGESVTVAESIVAYTQFAAYVNHCDDHRGRLAPGLAADVAVFSRDLLTATPDEILHDTHCDLTILDGVVVHDRLGTCTWV